MYASLKVVPNIWTVGRSIVEKYFINLRIAVVENQTKTHNAHIKQ